MSADKGPLTGQIFDLLLRAFEKQHGRVLPYDKIAYRRLLAVADYVREEMESAECVSIRVPLLEENTHLETVLCRRDMTRRTGRAGRVSPVSLGSVVDLLIVRDHSQPPGLQCAPDRCATDR